MDADVGVGVGPRLVCSLEVSEFSLSSSWRLALLRSGVLFFVVKSLECNDDDANLVISSESLALQCMRSYLHFPYFMLICTSASRIIIMALAPRLRPAMTRGIEVLHPHSRVLLAEIEMSTIAGKHSSTATCMAWNTAQTESDSRSRVKRELPVLLCMPVRCMAVPIAKVTSIDAIAHADTADMIGSSVFLHELGTWDVLLCFT